MGFAFSTNGRLQTFTTRRTDDVPAYTKSVVASPRRSQADETLEDGLAMQAELERYGTRPADSFIELDDFFRSLE